MQALIFRVGIEDVHWPPLRSIEVQRDARDHVVYVFLPDLGPDELSAKGASA